MARIGDNAYGEIYAASYDDLFQERDDLALVSSVLATLAGNQSALEFGIGTGRIALPLAARGVRVTGIDNSPDMLSRLQAKPGAEQITAVLGDCTTDHVEGVFDLVFIAFSTIYLFEDQDAQVRCFQNAARHLRPGGVFLVEGFVHDRSRWQNRQEAVTTHVSDHSVSLRFGALDPVRQLIRMQQVEITAGGITMRPNRLRFIYPAEMDLMARLAGMRLRDRWSDWSGAPFGAESGTQIAVYEKVAEAPLR
jgi:SAM-dependent methyltransferase